MWRLFLSTRATELRNCCLTIGMKNLIVVSTICLIMVACSLDEERQMRQPIDVGPWTFQVNRSLDRVDTGSSGEHSKKVIVFLKLENYMERHEQPFDDFLNGRSRSMIAFPHLKLVDEAGNKFDGWVSPESGGNMRSEEWRVEFLLIPSSMRDMLRANASDLAAEHLDKEPADFRLLIENPDPRSGQPRRIFVKLE